MRAWTAVLLLSAAALAATPALGPKDGRDLPPADLNRVQAGQPAPDFTLEAADGRPVTLSGFRGKRVVLVFYRGHW
ncbi:MAG: redoxin domain-containing protein [Acidobacteria bacterium]|nr:redoxin domain-containing protein [Acidobacteriota bacterium]